MDFRDVIVGQGAKLEASKKENLIDVTLYVSC